MIKQTQADRYYNLVFKRIIDATSLSFHPEKLNEILMSDMSISDKSEKILNMHRVYNSVQQAILKNLRPSLCAENDIDKLKESLSAALSRGVYAAQELGEKSLHSDLSIIEAEMMIILEQCDQDNNNYNDELESIEPIKNIGSDAQFSLLIKNFYSEFLRIGSRMMENYIPELKKQNHQQISSMLEQIKFTQELYLMSYVDGTSIIDVIEESLLKYPDSKLNNYLIKELETFENKEAFELR